MIRESYPWKRDLLRDADIIERWAAKKTDSEYRSMLLEKKVFLSAFVIRKLIEDYKITDRITESSILCRVYPSRGTEVNFKSRHDIDKHYDLSSVQRANINIRSFANQIIHNFVFMFEFPEERFSPIPGFVVASDLGKDRQLYGVTLSAYLSAMRSVGNDWVTEFHAARTKDGWKISKQ
jgi:hypothetical protein